MFWLEEQLFERVRHQIAIGTLQPTRVWKIAMIYCCAGTSSEPNLSAFERQMIPQQLEKLIEGRDWHALTCKELNALVAPISERVAWYLERRGA